MKQLLVAVLVLVCTVHAWAQAPAIAGQSVSGRVIVESGGAPPRLTLPVASPGRPVSNIAISPAADGTFKATLPEGSSVVLAVTGLPTGAAVRSITYGTANLQREVLNVSPLAPADLIIVVSMPRAVSVSGRVTGTRSPKGQMVVLGNTQFDAFVDPIDGTFRPPDIPPETLGKTS